MNEDRNESLEPLTVPQEQVRELRKAEEDIRPLEAGLPEEIEFSVADQPLLDVMAELEGVAGGPGDVAPEVSSIPTPEIGIPQASDFSVPEIEVPDVSSLGPKSPAPPILGVMQDMASVASQEARLAPEDGGTSNKPTRARTPREAAQMRLARRQSELNKAAVELGQVANEGKEKEPFNPAVMERAEAERLFFKQEEGADSVQAAYRGAIEEDKRARLALIAFLKELTQNARQFRLELDGVRSYLERDCV